MRINELNEAPLGMLGTAYQKTMAKIPGSIGASAQSKLDTSATEKRIQGINDFALRKWNEQLPTVKTMPGASDPETYYSYVKQFLTKYYRNQVTPADLAAITNPPTISTQGVQNIIKQATGKYMQQQAGFTAPAPAATPSQAAPSQDNPYNAAGALKPTNVNVKSGQIQRLQPANPMSYGGTAKATLGGAGKQAYTASLGGARQTTTAAAPAAPAAAPAAPPADYSSVQQAVTRLSKSEKQKILTQLLSQLGTNVR